MTVAESPRGRRLHSDLPWLLATIVATGLVVVVPLAWFHRYYFSGDTQIGAFGQWYYFGQQLLSGHWPVLNLWAWRGGNYAAEGQLGLWNPVSMLLGVTATKASNAVIFSTVVKGVFSLVAATGGYALARGYRLAPPFAFVVGSTLVLGGATQYLDEPSWVTGLIVWALLPWVWWAIRRTMFHRGNPLPAFVFAYLIVTIGYVYGTLYLGLVLLACLVDAARQRDRAAVTRVLALGVLAGLVAVVVYLPGILTAPVTIRDAMEITNDNNLPIQVSHYVTSMIPTAGIPTTVASTAVKPIGFIVWFLPVLTWIDVRRLRAAMRPMVGACLYLGIAILWTLGPSVVGPLRFPARVMPAVVLPAILLTLVLLAKATARPTRARLGASLLVVFVGTYVTASRYVPLAKEQLVAGFLVGLGTAGVWWVWRRRDEATAARAAATVSVLLVVWAIVLQGYQHHVIPDPPSLNRNMPAEVSAYKDILSGARGDVLVLGDQSTYVTDHPEAAKEILLASAWYVADRPFANTYTTISYRAYMERYCMFGIGVTCPRALATVLSTEPTTGKPRVDLLAASTLVLWKPSFRAAQLTRPPEGWHVAKETAHVLMWVRDKPIPTAGGVAATSDGTTVTTERQGPRSVSVRIDKVPKSGGTVTFSRIAWPGYSATNASLAAPVDGYLLTARVPAGASGRTVTLTFTPPGWHLGIGCLVASIFLVLLWGCAEAFLMVRRRRPPDGSRVDDIPALGEDQVDSAVPGDDVLDERGGGDGRGPRQVHHLDDV